MILHVPDEKKQIGVARVTLDHDGTMVLHVLLDGEPTELHIDMAGQMKIRKAVEDTREVFEIESGRGR